jgi:hypothetical protein
MPPIAVERHVMNHHSREKFPPARYSGWEAGLEPLSRRTFLRGALIAGMVVTTGITTGCSTLLGLRKAPEKLRYQHLKPDEVATLTKFTEAYLPTAKYGLPDSLKQVPTLANIDAMVGHMSAQTRSLLSIGLWFLEYRPMASFNFSRFSQLETDKARAYVHALQEGSFLERGLLTSMFSLVGVNYWRDPSTWGPLHYWGPVSVIWGVSHLGNAPLPPV